MRTFLTNRRITDNEGTEVPESTEFAHEFIGAVPQDAIGVEVFTPTSADIPADKPSIFLAGSIEMDKAEDWQRYAIMLLNKHTLGNKYACVMNPRRKDWDCTWKQDKSDQNFCDQVKWELSMLKKSTYIIMYLQPGTMSPISLLELGLHAEGKKMFVICPEGFWRKGNVDIVCEEYGIVECHSIDDAVLSIKIIEDNL